MPRQGYGKDTELLNAVLDCMSRKLSDKVAVDELNSRDIKIHPKKYQRIKAYIRKTMPQRLENLPHHEYQISLIDSIDTITALENFLKLKLASTKEDWLQVQLIGMILHCLVTREKFFESSHVVASVSKKIRKKQNVQEKSR
jgi:hypothetical protein